MLKWYILRLGTYFEFQSVFISLSFSRKQITVCPQPMFILLHVTYCLKLQPSLKPLSRKPS